MVTSDTRTMRPHHQIGKASPRHVAQRHVNGRGRFVDDVGPAGTLYVAFLRSPYAHTRILSIDVAGAMRLPGVVRVATGEEFAEICTPWTGTLEHLVSLRSAPQLPLAVDRALWQGEPVAAVVAESRAVAEDALELIDVAWEEQSPITDPVLALEPQSPHLHPSLGSNLAYERSIDTAGTKLLGKDGYTVSASIRTGRHTGVCLEPRGILAEFDPSLRRLKCYVSCQSPHMLRALFAKHLGLSEEDVQVVSPDVGGSFGIKVHLYGDEFATAALAVMLEQPVKFVSDRLEGFVSDVHSRDHSVEASLHVTPAGVIEGFELDDLSGIGAYSAYPRGSANEAKQIVNLVGAAYKSEAYRARTRLVFQNKPLLAQYRSVGHPVACLVTETLVDRAAWAIGMDPVEFRRQNLVEDDAYPWKTPSGVILEGLSHHAALNKLVELMDYENLRHEVEELRRAGVYRGLGLAVFIEMTNPSHATYGSGGAPIGSADSCTMQLLPNGSILCTSGVTEQGQGTEAMLSQVASDAVGLPLERVRVVTGDTEATPFGSGTWGSRGAGIGGEAALQAGKELRRRITALAAELLQTDADALDLQAGHVIDADTRIQRMSVKEVARIAFYRTDMLPPGVQPELSVTRTYRQATYDGIATNGVQASYVEVDVQTGLVKLLHHWVVLDCGTPINPLLVEEQLRGGVVQGLGAGLFEECLYDDSGQLLNGSLADYLVPMASEMPDITVGHVITPTATSELGAKGAGEAGTAGAAAAMLNAVNEALRSIGQPIDEIPVTPERVLRAVGLIS